MAWGEMDLTNGNGSLPLGVDPSERGLDAFEYCIAAFDNVLEECCEHELGAREDSDNNSWTYPPPDCDMSHWSKTHMRTAIFLDEWTTRNIDDDLPMDQFPFGAASTPTLRRSQ